MANQYQGISARDDFIYSLESVIHDYMSDNTDWDRADFAYGLARKIAEYLSQKTKPISHKELAQWVCHVRGSLGLSQRAFADRLGTHQVTVARWESGRCKPSPSYMRQIMILAQTRLQSAGPEAEQI